jgi:D-sedoheptulose 7-phosphate isomerase
MINLKSEIVKYFELEIEVIKNLNIDAINEAMNVIYNAYEDEKTIYIMGNGGSASTASHFVCDFNKGVSEKLEKKFRFNCLNDNIATIMAIANDVGYESVFSFQLENKLEEGDLLICISGSGNSRNIIKAAEYAKQYGNKVIGITGYDGGKLKDISDYSMHVNIKDMQIAEDVHMIFDHMMMRVFHDFLVNRLYD